MKTDYFRVWRLKMKCVIYSFGFSMLLLAGCGQTRVATVSATGAAPSTNSPAVTLNWNMKRVNTRAIRRPPQKRNRTRFHR